MNKDFIWKLCCGFILLLIILTFTPVIIPAGVDSPYFMGMPYTLWAGILLSFLFLVVTVLGSLVHPGRDADKKQEDHG